MQKLTAILVDDMPVALEMLVNDISNNHKEIEIMGITKFVVESTKLLHKNKSDIL